MKKIVHRVRHLFHSETGSTSKTLVLGLVGLSFLVVGAYAGINQFRPPAPQQQLEQEKEVVADPDADTVKLESPHTVVYGVWEGNSSVIKAFNLETKTSSVLSELPQNIKRVTAKLPDKIYYINDTNEFDHGKEIMRSVNGAKGEPVVIADKGFGIDDYFISSDGNYLTTWEVQLARRDALSGGKSRVYSINLNNPTVKNLIYDEVADKPIHYPRGITDKGAVITDMFLPNSGPGWGYGMSTSDVTGAKKVDSKTMTNGTYGRQPRISYDGTMLAFAGYDGTKGSGTEQMEGIRKAVIVPNTVEIVDAATLERKKLPNISNKFIYDDTRVDREGKHLLISQIKYINKQYKHHVMLYDLEKNQATEVPNSIDKRGFELMSDSQVFVSTPNVTGQTLGNLGETYQFLNSEFGVINPKNGKFASLPLNDNNMQFIGLYSNKDIALSSIFSNATAEPKRDTLQMYSFVLKTNLLPNRRNLQAASIADNARGTVQKTLGIKTFAQVPITPVATVAPIIPFGFTPEPGMVIPPGDFRRPGDVDQGDPTLDDPGAEAPDGLDPNAAPINNNNNGGNQNQPPVGGAPVPDGNQAPGGNQVPDGQEGQDGQEAPEGGEDGAPQLPGNGELPDDLPGLLELLKQLLGILEQEAQN